VQQSLGEPDADGDPHIAPLPGQLFDESQLQLAGFQQGHFDLRHQQRLCSQR
jgi:hypothetical protein